MSVAKLWDELWVEVKCQTNSEIAGSPRNALRCSLGKLTWGGRALDELGAIRLPNSTKLRMPQVSIPGVRLWGLSSIVERGTAQTIS